MEEAKKKEPEIVCFRIFDMPVELVKEYVAFAKLYHENKVWKVLERGMELMKLEEKKLKTQIDTRVTALEERVMELEKTVYNDEQNGEVRTIGSRRK